MTKGYSELGNKRVRAASGVDHAYRDTGPEASGGVPLVLFQHFRGNLDSWDPALIDALSSARRVITFDIYPDSAHGFLFQHHAEFAADIEAFLGVPGS